MKHALLAFLLLSACSENEAPRADTGIPSPGEVRHFGTVHAVMQGKWTSSVSLTEGLAGAGAYGLGALSELRGEFVAMPGQVWLSFPTTTPLPRVEKNREVDESAALLVAANASMLRKVTVEADVSSTEVESRIAAAAKSAGVDTSMPFLFVVEGTLRAVHWHVVDGTRVPPGTRPNETAQKGVVESAEATIVGFYSEGDEGVFTMMGQRTHMHAVLRDGSVAGHVESVEIPAGSTIAVP